MHGSDDYLMRFAKEVLEKAKRELGTVSIKEVVFRGRDAEGNTVEFPHTLGNVELCPGDKLQVTWQNKGLRWSTSK